MIAIVDYGVGNLFSLESSLKAIGVKAAVTASAEDLSRASGIILPGVGAFGDAAAKLAEGGLDTTLKTLAAAGKPLMGICLGMQLLFEKSYEYGEHEGLGLIKGEVKPLADKVKGLKIPHMGWNSLEIATPCTLLKNTNNGDYVYFVHSFYAECADKSDLAATADYGVKVTAAVSRGNVCGTQFHPEKSGAVGLKILKAFCDFAEGLC